jgi:hypothetical protein
MQASHAALSNLSKYNKPYFNVRNVHIRRSRNNQKYALIVPLLYSTGCLKKSFTTLKAYRNLYSGHTQLSKCSKTHRVLPRIVMA